jgi:transposase
MEDICKHDIYLGKRIKRGLFKSAIGKVINADVNGALNIGRKVFGDSFMIADSGRWYRPERINVLKCMCENVH